MLITLSRRAAICQSVVEVWLINVGRLGALNHRLNLHFLIAIGILEHNIS